MSEPARAGAPTPLAGCRILIVEDETIVSLMIEDMLNELGAAEIWHAAGIVSALAVLDERRPDAAVLDVNLAGESAYPIAERLAARGIPFIFATGYGREGLSPVWSARPALQKPFPLEALAEAMAEVLER